MKRIYESGKQTLIWLGPDENSLAGIAFSAIHRLGSEILHLSGKTCDHLNNKTGLEEVITAEPVKLDELRVETRELEALGYLYSRPWFTRLWVIQEFNANSAVSYWGQSHEDSNLVSLVATWIYHNPVRIERFYDKIGPGARYSVDMSNWSFRETSDTPHRGLVALHSASQFEVTDPRDRVYAMLGLPFLVSNLVADYTLSTSQVYLRLAQAYVSNGELEILNFGAHPYQASSDIEQWENGIYKPSWVPRWDCSQRSAHTMIDPLGFRAGVEAARNIVPEISGEAIILEALVFDTVASTFEINFDSLGLRVQVDAKDIPTATAIKYSESWCRLLRKVMHEATDENIYNAYERSLCWESLARISPLKQKIGFSHGEGALAFLLRTLCHGSWPHPDGLQNPETMPTNLNSSFSIPQFISCIADVQWGRLLLFSEGGYIGSGPGRAMAGDKVIICMELGRHLLCVNMEKGDISS